MAANKSFFSFLVRGETYECGNLFVIRQKTQNKLKLIPYLFVYTELIAVLCVTQDEIITIKLKLATMKTSKFNKSEIMTEAWSMFKNEDNKLSSWQYEFSFAECLRMAWATAKVSESASEIIISQMSVNTIFETIINDSTSFESEAILKEVSEKSNGFQSDIAKRTLEGKRISDKQAWCVAYEAKRVA